MDRKKRHKWNMEKKGRRKEWRKGARTYRAICQAVNKREEKIAEDRQYGSGNKVTGKKEGLKL